MKKNKKEEPKKEVGFISVINIIAGIILVIFGILILIIAIFSPAPGLFLPSALFFIFAVFLFLPQKVLRLNKWLKLLIAVVGFFVAAMIGGINMPSLKTEFVDYNLNEEFTITYKNVNFSMIIYNTTKEDKLIVNGEEKTTAGVFLLVYGTLINQGSYASELSFSSALIDSQNNTYSLFSASIGEGILQPNLERNFLNAFEIPKSAEELKFLVVDDTKIIKRVEL